MSIHTQILSFTIYFLGSIYSYLFLYSRVAKFTSVLAFGWPLRSGTRCCSYCCIMPSLYMEYGIHSPLLCTHLPPHCIIIICIIFIILLSSPCHPWSFDWSIRDLETSHVSSPKSSWLTQLQFDVSKTRWRLQKVIVRHLTFVTFTLDKLYTVHGTIFYQWSLWFIVVIIIVWIHTDMLILLWVTI